MLHFPVWMNLECLASSSDCKTIRSFTNSWLTRGWGAKCTRTITTGSKQNIQSKNLWVIQILDNRDRNQANVCRLLLLLIRKLIFLNLFLRRLCCALQVYYVYWLLNLTMPYFMSAYSPPLYRLQIKKNTAKYRPRKGLFLKYHRLKKAVPQLIQTFWTARPIISG